MKLTLKKMERYYANISPKNSNHFSLSQSWKPCKCGCLGGDWPGVCVLVQRSSHVFVLSLSLSLFVFVAAPTRSFVRFLRAHASCRVGLEAVQSTEHARSSHAEQCRSDCVSVKIKTTSFWLWLLRWFYSEHWTMFTSTVRLIAAIFDLAQNPAINVFYVLILPSVCLVMHSSFAVSCRSTLCKNSNSTPYVITSCKNISCLNFSEKYR